MSGSRCTNVRPSDPKPHSDWTTKRVPSVAPARAGQEFGPLRSRTPGPDLERFKAKAAAYLKAHQDHVALQRLRRNKPLTPDDLQALERMLVDSGAGDSATIAEAKEESQGLGLFVRSLVGLDHQAALEAFAQYLDGSRFNANQLHFINLIVGELTNNGVMAPARLYESPFTDPRTVKQQGIEALGAKNAARVEHAIAAIDQIAASEAARAGWLGDVDFTADLNGIIGNLRKAHDLRKVADQLSGLDKPSADDRKILVEAKAAIETLEGAAVERVKLIEKCATEARLVDESLRKERDDALTEEQRAELHAKLSVMLYGIKATPDATSTETATDAVIARVCAYREIKNEIQHVRDNSL